MDELDNKYKSCQHTKLKTTVFLCFLLNFLLICAFGLNWVLTTQRLSNLERENVEIRNKLAEGFKGTCCVCKQDIIEKDRIIKEEKREILSLSTQQLPVLMAQMQNKVSAFKNDIATIESRVRFYHPTGSSDISCQLGYRLNPHSLTCFRFVQATVNWSEAKTACEKQGESLATFHTLEAAAWFRHQQIAEGWKDNQTDHVWIGGHLEDKVWTWDGIITGHVAVSYWGHQDPNGDGLCMVTWGKHYYWRDNPCDRQRSYVCERKAELV